MRRRPAPRRLLTAARLCGVAASAAVWGAGCSPLRDQGFLAGPNCDPEVIAETERALVARWEDPESAEGIAAFFEKRAPSWQA